MGTVVAIDTLFSQQLVWHGRCAPQLPTGEPTGWAALDDVLPSSGWPRGALTEILLPADGVGELRLVLPTLARLTRARRCVAVIAPPYIPYVPGWALFDVDMRQVEFVNADPTQALWAMEQCLRSGSCAAVLGWPQRADDRALRRLQVAADTGDALAFAFRDRRHALNASPAALRLDLETHPELQVRVRKCRGGQPPAHPLRLPTAWI